MGWFGGGSSDTGGGDTGFQSKKRSPADYSLGGGSASEELDLSAGSSPPMGGGGDFGNMSDSDIQRRVAQMQQQAQLAQGIAKINGACFDLCDVPASDSLSGRSETCLKNCAGRYIDCTLLITQRFQQLVQKMQHQR